MGLLATCVLLSISINGCLSSILCVHPINFSLLILLSLYQALHKYCRASILYYSSVYTPKQFSLQASRFRFLIIIFFKLITLTLVLNILKECVVHAPVYFIADINYAEEAANFLNLPTVWQKVVNVKTPFKIQGFKYYKNQ